MRIVEREAELAEAVDSARREAEASFGDDTVFLERWVTSSRHVEIQVMGDLHGNVVHFFERECSIQRRHQKIIEEAPSPAVSPELRAKMGEGSNFRCQENSDTHQLERSNSWYPATNSGFSRSIHAFRSSIRSLKRSLDTISCGSKSGSLKENH